MMTKLNNLLLLMLIGALAFGGYRLLRERALGQVYRQRLEALATRHNALRDRYNHVVERTAITELVVERGKLSVAVVGSDGVIETLPMPYDPSREIHVDYVIREGRLWIRRVYDDATAPDHGTLVAPKLAALSWDKAGKEHGLTIYRPLGEGRWVVQVTPNGALSLVTQPLDHAAAKLAAPPAIVDFQRLDAETQAAADEVGSLELLQAML